MAIDEKRKAWLTARLDGIGGSDAPIIMGVSKHRTILDLWKEKTERIIDDTPDEYILKQGHDLENWARPLVEMDIGQSFRPANCVHPEHKFLMASLDGWNPESKEIWECKFMSADEVDLLTERKLAPMDRVPKHYRPQLYHLFMVTGAKTLYFSGIKRKKNEEGKWQRWVSTVKIDYPTDDYIRNQLIPAELAFWKCVTEKTKPKSDVDIYDKELQNLIAKYGKLENKISGIQEKVKAYSDKMLGERPAELAVLKKEIEKHPARTGKKMVWDKFALTNVEGAARVNWKEAFEVLYKTIVCIKLLSSVMKQAECLNKIPNDPDLSTFTKKGKAYLKIGRRK